MPISERIKFLVETLEKGNQRQFALKVGVTPTVVGSFMPPKKEGDRVSSPSYEALSKIISAYPHINTDWLITGKGQPFKNSEPAILTEPAAKYQAKTGMPLVVTLDNQHRENIEIVETRAAAGYIKHHLEPEYIKDLPKLYLPGPEFRNATFRCFQAQGDSMHPGIQNSDLVIGSYVHNWPTNIQEGFVYIVVTRTDVVIKRLLNRVEQRGKVVIQSDNEAWATDEIDAADIVEVWRAKAKISFKFPNLRYDTHKKIAKLEADMFELRQLVTGRIGN